MTSLQWILGSYLRALPDRLKWEFLTMPVEDFLKLPPFQAWSQRHYPVIHDLGRPAWKELAGGNVLIARKAPK
jgi:hypothetical protein